MVRLFVITFLLTCVTHRRTPSVHCHCKKEIPDHSILKQKGHHVRLELPVYGCLLLFYFVWYNSCTTYRIGSLPITINEDKAFAFKSK